MLGYFSRAVSQMQIIVFKQCNIMLFFFILISGSGKHCRHFFFFF